MSKLPKAARVAEFIPLLQWGLLVKKSPPLPAEAARVGMASLLPTQIPRVVFFTAALAPFHPVPW